MLSLIEQLRLNAEFDRAANNQCSLWSSLCFEWICNTSLEINNIVHYGNTFIYVAKNIDIERKIRQFVPVLTSKLSICFVYF